MHRIVLAIAWLMLTCLPVSAEWLIETKKRVYSPGERITVNYEGFINKRDWMIVVPVGTPDDVWQGYEWTYRNNLPEDGTFAFKALKPGQYEARAYCCWGRDGFRVLSRSRFDVRAATNSASGNAQVPARAMVDGKYSGLITSFACEKDRASYGRFSDYGKWGGGSWCGKDRPAGYWVWVAPKWYVWSTRNRP